MKFIIFLLIFGCLAYFYHRLVKTLRMFSGIRSQAVSGAWQVARRVLDSFQLFDVLVEEGSSGEKSVYRINRKTLFLSAGDYESSSFLSIARALYEVNRVLQHMRGDVVIYATTYIKPWSRIAGAFSFILIFAAMVPSLQFFYLGGVSLFFIDMLVSLPVFVRECETLRRFYAELESRRLFPEEELKLVQKVLEVMPFENLTGLFAFWAGMKRLLCTAISANSSKP